jgi:hypothetical protein
VWFPSVLIDVAGMPWSFRFLNIRFIAPKPLIPILANDSAAT